MRKTIIFLLVFGFALSTTGAWAYTFPNGTLVEYWTGTTGSGYWVDRIGDPANFETYGANLSGNTLTIFTNWGGEGFSTLGATTAALFIDTDLIAGWNAAIVLDGSDKGKIYYNPTYMTSQDVFSGTGHSYGGQYDPSAPKPIPTVVTGGTSIDSLLATVTWTPLGSNPDYSIAINLTNVDNFNPLSFAFLWGTGTCANDTAEGKVPIPPTALLFGGALLGLVGLGWRRRTS
jgi:hypothetical protein